MEPNEQMDLIIFCIIFSLVISYLIHAELFFRKLNQSAPDVYSELGSPSVIGKKQSVLPILRFFTSKEYKQLEDKTLVQMGDRLAIHFILTMSCMITFFGYLHWSGQL